MLVPETYDAEIQNAYGDILAGGSLEPNTKPGDAEAKVKMHINTSRASSKGIDRRSKIPDSS